MVPHGMGTHGGPMWTQWGGPMGAIATHGDPMGTHGVTVSYICCVRVRGEGILEWINEPPWGRCLQGVDDARWVVVVVVCYCCCLLLLLLSSPHRGWAILGSPVGSPAGSPVGSPAGSPAGSPQGGHFIIIVLRHTASLFCHHIFRQYR